MDKVYSNYISLGYFCEVASDLEKMGLRSFSSPFDWGISSFPGVIDAIENKFYGFMDYDNLLQSKKYRYHYYETRYHFWFYHDFSDYKPLIKQYDKVKEKYWRRITRFLRAIEYPTLFFRYISSSEVDEDGKSEELIWIEENYHRILNVLRSYNPDNCIIFIGDETVHSSIIKIYNVTRDKNDTVSRSPICNNKELLLLLSDIEFPGKETNQQRYLSKEKKKNSVFARNKRMFLRLLQKVFLKVYKHDREYFDTEV